uniref:CUB domain-containing protein n=1 Tax=Mesocestoides corti TaxID=53468 RepID=A0A5K3FLS6_MESCO
MRVLCCVFSLLIASLLCVRTSLSGVRPRKYILTRDCALMPTAIVGLEEQHTKILRIDDLVGGAVIYSHDFESVSQVNSTTTLISQNAFSRYPLGFSCEVVVHAPIENGRIMLTISSFFIPSSDRTCKDDFLYVFDSNTARSKAMPEAGGEQGLCLSHYPKIPVVSSRSYICIAFHTSNAPMLRFPPTETMVPGFKIVVTAFQETKTASCSSSRFYCGETAGGGSNSGGRQTARGPSVASSTSTGICVSESVRCDGVINCPDGKDESPSMCEQFAAGSSLDVDGGWLAQFLSLGLGTSVSIVLVVALVLLFCVGCIICACCHRGRSSTNGFNGGRATGTSGGGGGVDYGGAGTDISVAVNGSGHKPPDSFRAMMPPSQHQQLVLPPAKSVGDLYPPHQQPPNSPLVQSRQYPTPPPSTAWNMQSGCCPTQWYPTQHPHQLQGHLPALASDPSIMSTTDACCYPAVATTNPPTNVPTSLQQQQQHQQHLMQSTRYLYQHPEDPVRADGGIVYLGEIGGGGSGSGGSRLAAGSRRPRRRSSRALDTQSSSSVGGGPSTRDAQSAEGAPRTTSNSSLSVGHPSWSSSRGATANNHGAGNNATRHHRHRRRRHGGNKQSHHRHQQHTETSEKIAFPVEL